MLSSPPRIAHVITDLNGFGGTEATLLRYLVASGIPPACHRIIVLKNIGEGDTLGAQMVAAGFSVLALRQRRGAITLSGIRALLNALRDFEPQVISAWLYHPSLLATLLAPFVAGRPAVVWHIRSLPFAGLFRKPGRFLVQRMLALLSRLLVPMLVSNSEAAAKAHQRIGFRTGSPPWAVVPNGLDMDKYFPSAIDRLEVRAELALADDALVLGCVGRVVPEKGYDVFFEALSRALNLLPADLSASIHVVAIGNGVTPDNAELVAWAGSLQHRCRFLGKRADVARLMRAMDVYVLPSVSESFPNSLVEAMATGLACLATDVGQCGDVMPDPAHVVPPGQSEPLARAMVAMLQLQESQRLALGAANRQHVSQRYDLAPMARRFDEIFISAAAASAREADSTAAEA